MIIYARLIRFHMLTEGFFEQLKGKILIDFVTPLTNMIGSRFGRVNLDKYR
jgi:hypothetical protein